jgi:hypothetical protein
MSISIDESGVTFGPFAQTDVFEFEKVLKEIKFGDNVFKAEFIVRRASENVSIIVVEAKSSIPRESDNFFEDIRQKMVHTLTVWFASVCGCHESVKALLPENLGQFENLTLPIQLCLVIPQALILHKTVEESKKIVVMGRLAPKAVFVANNKSMNVQ